MAEFLFFLLSFVCLGSVLAMIVSRNQAHNALFLVLAFAALGGIFGLAGSPFLAAVQVLIYAGAIMVLFLFAVMMIDPRRDFPRNKKRGILYLSVVCGLALLIEIVWAVRAIIREGAPPGSPVSPASQPGSGDPAALGKRLFTEYIYPFEITSVLILAALVGALVLTKKKDKA